MDRLLRAASQLNKILIYYPIGSSMDNFLNLAFRPISIDDRSSFLMALEKDPPEISEFTFTNLYAWRLAYKFEAVFVNELMLLRSLSGPEPRYFVPIGRGDKAGIMEQALSASNGSFIRVPGSVAKSLDAEIFILEPDRDNFDYLYRMADLVSLKGKTYDGKRNSIRKFKASYKYEYVELNAMNARECLDFEESWCVMKDCDKIASLGSERDALKEMLVNFDLLNLEGAVLKVGEKICAMALGEALSPGTMVLHILKADASKDGSYQVMLRDFLSRRAERFEYLNMEQDLGLEGLRRSKLSYGPCRMIDKYTIRIRGGRSR